MLCEQGKSKRREQSRYSLYDRKKREREGSTFSTVILRPSTSALFKCSTQAFACSGVSTPINPKPLDSRVRGSVTSLMFIT